MTKIKQAQDALDRVPYGHEEDLLDYCDKVLTWHSCFGDILKKALQYYIDNPQPEENARLKAENERLREVVELAAQGSTPQGMVKLLFSYKNIGDLQEYNIEAFEHWDNVVKKAEEALNDTD